MRYSYNSTHLLTKHLAGEEGLGLQPQVSLVKFGKPFSFESKCNSLGATGGVAQAAAGADEA